MWDIKKESCIIQIEIGEGVLCAYSSKKRSGDILFSKLDALKKVLEEQNITPPKVQAHSW